MNLIEEWDRTTWNNLTTFVNEMKMSSSDKMRWDANILDINDIKPLRSLICDRKKLFYFLFENVKIILAKFQASLDEITKNYINCRFYYNCYLQADFNKCCELKMN